MIPVLLVCYILNENKVFLLKQVNHMNGIKKEDNKMNEDELELAQCLLNI